MVYAVRQYIKGVKGSGTKDLWVGDVIPTRQQLIESYGGNGKFVIMERGKGIRGMRKVAEYEGEENNNPIGKSHSSSSKLNYKPITHSEWMPKVFAAENRLSVRKEIKLDELSDEDLNGLWTSMLETPVESDEDFRRFVGDNEKIRDEVYRRLNLNDTEKAAESDIEPSEASTGLGYGTVVTAGLAGLVAGAVIQEVRWKRRMDESETRIRRLEEMLDSLERNADTKAAEQRAVANGGGSLATHDVLRAFNTRSGF